MTDSGTEIRFDREAKPGVSNLLTIYSAITGQSVEALVAAYQGVLERYFPRLIQQRLDAQAVRIERGNGLRKCGAAGFDLVE